MQCLIVRQPYASLIAFGKKRWEFRNREIKKRGLVGIAASPNEPYRTWSDELNRVAPLFPRGVVLATAEMITSFYITGQDLKAVLTEPIEVMLHGNSEK